MAQPPAQHPSQPPAQQPAQLRVDPVATRLATVRRLAERVRGEVRVDHHDRMLYATDASIYQVEPCGVVIPADGDDLAGAVRACAELDLPILPRGGGTSLAGQGVAEAVVIDVSAHVRSVRSIDAAARRCVVEAGCTVQDLNAALAPSGLFFAPDPATVRQANIGGVIGNNAAGTRSIRYGRTAENLHAVEAVLADGTVAWFGRGSAARAAAESPVRRITEAVVDVVQRHESLIRERFPRTLRRNAGYALDMILAQCDAARAAGTDPLEIVNLASLLCGSEGTLAVTRAADLALHPVPAARGLAVIGFDRLDAAIDAVEPLLETHPTAVELLDDLIVGLARENRATAAQLDLMPQPPGGPLAAVLLCEFWEDGPDAVTAGLEAVQGMAATRFAGAAIETTTDPAAIARALALRAAGEPLLHGIPGHRKPVGFVEDNAVPVERLSEFVRRFRAIVEGHGTRASFYAHASVGVLHVRPLLDLRDAGDRDRMVDIAACVADLARELGGVMSGEHGDGRVRGPLLEPYFGPELMDAFRAVKAIFDPDGRLNPGNIVQPEAIETIHERLRVRPHGRDLAAPAIDTWFDFERDGGFGHAVELCNGAGVCRASTGGTMCPSYRATRDERHATRGRGNALRLAMTGQVGLGSESGAAAGTPDADGAATPVFGDPETLETLDLCLSCKACGTECPSNVDIATYKAEYLAQSYRAAGRTPWSAQVFGRVRTINRLGSMFAPLSSWVAELAPVRWFTNRLLGLAAERRLPRFERSLMSQLPSRVRDAERSGVGDAPRATSPAAAAGDRQPDASSSTPPTVILYADCFTTYNEPHLGLATVRVLEAFGYRVHVPEVDCCGRPPISTGLLDEAVRRIARSAERLDAAVRATDAVAVIACEPSCVSAMQHEWTTLRGVRDTIDADRLEWFAAHAMLPLDFLERHWDAHPQHPVFVPDRIGGGHDAIAYHGHCHEKALGGQDASVRLLRRIFGDRVQVLDTGCCGMAGSFGYAAHRYDVSMAVGELALFPLVRALGADDVVVMQGTSCRHQLRDGVPGLRGAAVHPIELLDRAIIAVPGAPPKV